MEGPRRKVHIPKPLSIKDGRGLRAQTLQLSNSNCIHRTLPVCQNIITGQHQATTKRMQCLARRLPSVTCKTVHPSEFTKKRSLIDWIPWRLKLNPRYPTDSRMSWFPRRRPLAFWNHQPVKFLHLRIKSQQSPKIQGKTPSRSNRSICLFVNMQDPTLRSARYKGDCQKTNAGCPNPIGIFCRSLDLKLTEMSR